MSQYYSYFVTIKYLTFLMKDYQVCKWLGRHHHTAMVIIAMLFMTRQRLLYQDEVPLLSCYDIGLLLNHFLSRKITQMMNF